MYVYMYRTSFCKCLCILIHWTGSILLSVIQFFKYQHVQIVETCIACNNATDIELRVHTYADGVADIAMHVQYLLLSLSFRAEGEEAEAKAVVEVDNII